MSRRSRTILTLSLQVPVPAGKTQKQVLAHILEVLHGVGPNYSPTQFIIKIEKREVTYL